MGIKFNLNLIFLLVTSSLSHFPSVVKRFQLTFNGDDFVMKVVPEKKSFQISGQLESHCN